MDKPKLLVIEDDDNQRLLYEEELRYAGYEVVSAKSGQEGLAVLREQAIAVVLLDIAMPGMDGIETLGKILDLNNEMPVVLNTAYSSYKDDFMTWAAEAYVVKSSDLTELRRTLCEVLAKRGIDSPDQLEEQGS